MAILNNLLNVGMILLGFGVLIFWHELGHFLAAKWAGIRTEAFAVGMGPVAISWRKGIGFKLGSTAASYQKRVEAFLNADDAHQPRPGSDGVLSQADLYRIGDKLGLGETEYSLRWLPIGGFVKMLGQEDANPNAVSDDPRSYNMRPIGKRMVVVSAGVIMNVILAIVLFIIAFMAGVKFPAPVIGDLAPGMPAASARASIADSAGLVSTGLQPGDEVVAIDGEPARTFGDLQIASAMGRPGVPAKLTIRRDGLDKPLEFSVLPRKDVRSGLLGIGIDPGRSTTLLAKDPEGYLADDLDRLGIGRAGVKPGMRMIRANGSDLRTFAQLQQRVRESEGKPVAVEWSALDATGNPTGAVIRTDLSVEPVFQQLGYVKEMPAHVYNYEPGLLGLTPLAKIETISADSQNVGVLRPGDVILAVGGIEGPRRGDVMLELGQHKGGTVALKLLRDATETSVVAKVDGNGRINVTLVPAWNLPVLAKPMAEVRVQVSPDEPELRSQVTPVSKLRLIERTRIDTVGGVPVSNWADMRREFRAQSVAARADGSGATFTLGTTLPTNDHPTEQVELQLSAEQVAMLHALDWEVQLGSDRFEPIMTTLTAEGSPFLAVTMGLRETRKAIVLTYLTIDRLFRGSVGVEQLRGPVGIIHLGSKVADQGLMYMIFFLGMISVNLAVINFLPLPIVDGGLFLFLIYEKFKGRPPSLAFQNAATIAGLFLIGTIFLVTFYNDVMRLFN